MLVVCSSRARRASARRAVAAEHALEHDARVQLHRQRLRRRAPRDRVHVGAEEVGGAGAEDVRAVLDRELHRRERRALADLLRDDLVDRRVELDQVAARCVRARREEAGAGRMRVRAFGVEARDDVEVLAQACERFQDHRQLEARAGRLRHPDVHDRAVRNVDRAEAQRRLGRRSARARAGVIASSSGSATAAPTPFKTVRRDRCFLLMNISFSPLCEKNLAQPVYPCLCRQSAFGTGRSSRARARTRRTGSRRRRPRGRSRAPSACRPRSERGPAHRS